MRININAKLNNEPFRNIDFSRASKNIYIYRRIMREQ